MFTYYFIYYFINYWLAPGEKLNLSCFQLFCEGLRRGCKKNTSDEREIEQQKTEEVETN